MGFLGKFEKEPADEFSQPVLYDDVALDSETISSSTLNAIKLSDGTQDNSVLLATSATLLTGTATGGSTTTLIDTGVNFATLGVKVGYKFYNTTQKWVAQVTKISTTTNAFDTLHFVVQATSAASGDTYDFLVSSAAVQAGTTGEEYKITWTTTMSTGRIFEDTVLMVVRDHS